jgi:hypothetical protein
VDQIEARVAALPGVRACTLVGPRDGGYSEYRVESDHGTDVGERLFELVRGAGWMLNELRTERASLEDVFIALTKGQALTTGQAVTTDQGPADERDEGEQDA